ncbi:MAG: hypothetical protein WCK87_03250, partial [Candidatus Saccharibacteria bacterium]
RDQFAGSSFIAFYAYPPNGASLGALTGVDQQVYGPAKITGSPCALIAGGTVKCWGPNANGELGNGTTSLYAHSAATVVPGLTGVTAIGGSYGSSCAVINGGANGTVKCWGLYQGLNRTNALSPRTIPNLTGVTSVSAHYTTNCAVINGGTNGTVKCWGNNSFGQNGDQFNRNDVNNPYLVPGLTGVKSVSVGGNHVVALMADGTVRGWGRNAEGQLGGGSTTENHKPSQILNLTNVYSVVADGSNTCALINGGTMKCTGDNKYGQLGNGSTTNQNTFTLVPGLTNLSNISLSANKACAVIIGGSGGSVKCWGANTIDSGQGSLGVGLVDSAVKYPTLIPALGGVTSVAGDCATVTGGYVECWNSPYGDGINYSDFAANGGAENGKYMYGGLKFSPRFVVNK